MSDYDYSGIDTGQGRWWTVVAVWLMLIGIVGSIVVMGLVAGKFIED